jgi:hypothetical protein
MFIEYRSKKRDPNAPPRLLKANKEPIARTTKFDFSFLFNIPNLVYANANNNNYHLHYSQPLDQEYSL